ncbi:Outer membrane protein assembly factor BamA [Candidatus Hepatincolaceae symbiont of Richtersius coronifer]
MKILKAIFFSLFLYQIIFTTLYAVSIKHLEIQGNERVELDYIESVFRIAPGTDYNENLVNEGLKRLYNTDLFSDISSSFQNSNLVIILKENPLIDDLQLNGNKKIKKDVIEKEMLSKKRTTFSQSKLNLDIQRITDLYYKSGYFSVAVTSNIVQKELNRIDVQINIIEGKKTTIDQVIFVGNQKFSSSTLGSVILTRPDRFWRILNPGEIYDKNRILYDGELLKQFYLENGYPNFTLISTFSELLPQNGKFIITYNLDEGERYRFGNSSLIIRIPELQSYEEEIKAVISLNTQDWFKNSLLQREVNKLKDKINELGYQFVTVNTQLIYNDIARRVDIAFVIQEEERLFINRIEINNNTKTRDYVIRRELKFLEQDYFSNDRVNVATTNLYRTRYFSSVNITNKPSEEPGKLDLNIDVAEISTGQITAGGGFSTLDGLSFEMGFAESNLFGSGKYLSLNAGISRNTNTYSISVSEPYFLGRELYSSVSLYRTESGTNRFSQRSLYKTTQVGISTSLGYYLTNTIRQSVGYEIFNRNIFGVYPDSPLYIKEIEGKAFISVISHSISYDTRNNALYPSRGVDLSLSTFYAGLLGNVAYLKNIVKGVWYYSLYEDIVFSALGSAGIIEGLNGQTVSIRDKFNLGGATLRGFTETFDRGGIGPTDIQTNETLGGRYMYRGSLQIETPFPGIKDYGLLVHTFLDFGTVTDRNINPALTLDSGSLRASVGVGLSWRSPAGTISIDFGYPIKKEPTDSSQTVLFSFGTRL